MQSGKYMNRMKQLVKQVLADIRLTSRYTPILLLVAFSWSYLAGVTYLTNAFGYFPLKKLLEAIVLLPVIYVPLAWLVGHFLIAPQVRINKQKLFSLLISCIVIFCMVIVIFPPPLPGLAQAHRMKLVVLGEKNELSSGMGVKIAKIRNLDGRSISWDSLLLSGDWQIIDGTLVSDGKENSALEYSQPAYGGIVFNFLYDNQSGVIEIYWDDVLQNVDLYAPTPTILNTILKTDSWKQLEPPQVITYVLTLGLYIIGIASLILFLVLGSELYGSKKLAIILTVCFYLLAFLFFVKLKFVYQSFDAERVFRDTYSYVVAAEKPLSSTEFWIGERSFTLPLMFKLLGINTLNYQTNAAMSSVAQFQTWLSIICWALLGFTFGISLRRRWLGVGAFGIILLFSLCLEISLWDSLLLSESISLSLFACLVGLWVLLEMISPNRLRTIVGWIVFLVMLIVTILYSFTRDTNLYFVLICAPFFALIAWVKKKDKIQRVFYSVYAVFVIALFTFQSYSVSNGNRWQILIYDNLALRLLKDEQAINYLDKMGLPIDDALMSVTTMTPPEYQKYFLNSDKMDEVRTWVNSNGKTIYLRYLISRPGFSLLKPIYESNKLINGSSVEYRRERQPNRPIAEVITRISNIFYPRSPLILGFMLVISIIGAVNWLSGREKKSVWVIIMALVVSIYPLMFIVWHGNPMEVERHAVQIAVQFRLAGWMAVVVWLAWLSSKIETGHFSKFD
jgi:hypothetical protein